MRRDNPLACTPWLSRGSEGGGEEKGGGQVQIGASFEFAKQILSLGFTG